MQLASTAATNIHSPTSASRAPRNREPELVRWEREASAQRAKNEATLPSSIGREKRANLPEVRSTRSHCQRRAVHPVNPLKDAVSVLGAIRDWKNNF
jgi:hypothetical protein